MSQVVSGFGFAETLSEASPGGAMKAPSEARVGGPCPPYGDRFRIRDSGGPIPVSVSRLQAGSLSGAPPGRRVGGRLLAIQPRGAPDIKRIGMDTRPRNRPKTAARREAPICRGRSGLRRAERGHRIWPRGIASPPSPAGDGKCRSLSSPGPVRRPTDRCAPRTQGGGERPDPGGSKTGPLPRRCAWERPCPTIDRDAGEARGARPAIFRIRSDPARSEEEPGLEAEPGLGPVGRVGRPGDGAAEVDPVADRLAKAGADVEVRHAAPFLDVAGVWPGVMAAV